MIQFRRGTVSQATSLNETLAEGQPFLETDTNKLKIGNGSSAYSDLPYIGGGNSGKIYATIVVGTSTAGYTSTDVDYLCDGVNDEVEIMEAFNQIKSGGRIILTSGQFNIQGELKTSYISGDPSVVLQGQGASTILNISQFSADASWVFLLYPCMDIQSLQVNINVPSMVTHPSTIFSIRSNYSRMHDCILRIRGDSSNSITYVNFTDSYCMFYNNTIIYDSDASSDSTTIVEVDNYSQIFNNLAVINNCVREVFYATNGSVVSSNVVTGKFECAIYAGGSTNGFKYGTVCGNSIYDTDTESSYSYSSGIIETSAGYTCIGNSIYSASTNSNGISVHQGNVGDIGGTACGNVVIGGNNGIVTADNGVLTGNLIGKQVQNCIGNSSGLWSNYVTSVGNRVTTKITSMNGTGCTTQSNTEFNSLDTN